jgi:hypothetical protein
LIDASLGAAASVLSATSGLLERARSGVAAVTKFFQICAGSDPPVIPFIGLRSSLPVHYADDQIIGEAHKPRVAVVLARTGFAGDTGAIHSGGSAGAVLNNVA